MFYSQFILAKKGPLGTIWIAAHLERKLRKNQVADTDIGFSVDSILFPEVPIALRLSSHLLLGVVRIYSRKVNYLFDDCSEALLKIKQAFRSTAVDLPPEESKAPYHSITLPETFDLDDFELPDNDIFQGNYVDHHISSREQITLQDNIEGVVYSTSQFGLDERFGDGDALGLDLDEELFLHKVDAAGRTGVSADPQTSGQPMIRFKQDDPDQMPAHSETRIEVPGLDVELMEYAQAPCTPGLVEEPNLSNVQETSACEDHMESEDTHLMESAVKENSPNVSSKSDLQQGNVHLVDWSLPDDTNSNAVIHMPCKENGFHSSKPGIKQGQSPSEVGTGHGSSDDPALKSGTYSVVADDVRVTGQEPNLTNKVLAASDTLDRREELLDEIPKIEGSHEDHGECNGISSKASARDTSFLAGPCQEVTEGISSNNQTATWREESNDVEIAGNQARSCSPIDAFKSGAEFQDTDSLEKPEHQVSQQPKDVHVSKELDHDEMSCDQVHILRPCNASMSHPNSSHAGGEHFNDPNMPSDVGTIPVDSSEVGEVVNASGASAMFEGEKCDAVDDSQQVLKENHVTSSGKSDDQVNNVVGEDFPVRETLLSVPEELSDQPRNLLVEATPGDLGAVDESDAGSRFVSGKKRSYTESTLTEQSLNSVESSRVVRSKRTVESIPDDDDLLSSILVGRRSSVFKMKPTPPPSEITSLKRHRSAPRTTASKRKVLMDDTMVLHGDTIRLQLTNTEDIRRLRKKAPCTRPEIAMIQKQFLEEEIFGEPICSGMLVELASLHGQTYDLSRITLCQDAMHSASLLTATDMKLTSGNDEITEHVALENSVDLGRPAVSAEKHMGEGSELAVARENCEVLPNEALVLTDPKVGEHDELNTESNITQPQIKLTNDVTEAAEPLQPGHLQHSAEIEIDGERSSLAEVMNSAFPTEIESSDRVSGNVGELVAGTVQISSLDKESVKDALLQTDAAVVPSDEKREAEYAEVDASVTDGSTRKIDDEKDDTLKVDDIMASVEHEPSARNGVFLDDIQCGTTPETEKDSDKLGLEYNTCGPATENETCVGRVEYNDQICEGISDEQPIINSAYPVEYVNVQGSSLDDGECPMQHEAYPRNLVDAEVFGIIMHGHDDLNYSAAANDTEFLNADDDEVAEVTDDYTPNAEEMHLTENSGWSSRTRAVAKYLQTLFIKEEEYGRRALPMDNLLVGKTRKEASRMFFEALVLKTKDYVHVEQERPFGNITIKPRTKLVKSDF